MAAGEPLDAFEARQVADVVLRHRTLPTGDLRQARLALNREQFSQRGGGDFGQLAIVVVQKLALAGAADEDPDQDVVFRRRPSYFTLEKLADRIRRRSISGTTNPKPSSGRAICDLA